MPKSSYKMTEKNSRLLFILGLAGLLVLMFFFWDTIFVYPVKIFVVFLHELSHGLAAVLTGGRIVKIEISPNLGGSCMTQGGNLFLVLSAGYLGSMFWGGIILTLASRTKWDKYISMVIGVVLLAVTLIFIRNLFGFIFGLVFGAALFLSGMFLPEKFNDFVLRFIGLTSLLYAIFDIKDDLITRSVAQSDASVMARELFGTSAFWGIIWMAISLVATVAFIIVASKGEKKKDPYLNP